MALAGWLARALRGPLFELEAELEADALHGAERVTIRVRARGPGELDDKIQAWAASLCWERNRVILARYRATRLED